MTAFLGANPRLKKKDLAGQLGKHAAWVTRFTQAARLADDPQHITADQATAILRKAHGKGRRAAKQGRVCTLQSPTARIVRALRDGLRFHYSVLQIHASVEAALSLAGIAPERNAGTEWRS